MSSLPVEQETGPTEQIGSVDAFSEPDVEEPQVLRRPEVTEREYVPAGQGPVSDTTDEGWNHTVSIPPVAQGPIEPPPRVPSSATLVPAPRSEPPSFVDDPEEAATVRFESHQADEQTRLDDGPGFGSMGNFDDAPPPTDEVPSAVLQDVSQPYTAPMNVPEPPPIPGILDRYTPAGAHTRQRSKQTDVRPSYIADTPAPPPMLERPDRAPPVETRSKPRPPVEDDEGSGRTLVLFGLVGALVLFGVTLALMLFVFGVGITRGPSSTEPEVLTGKSGAEVPVKENLNTVPEPEVEPEPEPEADPDPEPAPEPSAAPDPSPRPRPRPRPRPAPAPAPEPVEEAPALGTLSIRSNRKVLVYVDGTAVGYTPTSYKAKPGSRTVSAMLPGQPQSKDSKTVNVKGGDTISVNFAF